LNLLSLTLSSGRGSVSHLRIGRRFHVMLQRSDVSDTEAIAQRDS